MVKHEQISVPVDPELRESVERATAKEDRSAAGQIRHLIARRRVKRLGRARATMGWAMALSDTFFNDVGGAVSDIFASQGYKYKAEGEA